MKKLVKAILAAAVLAFGGIAGLSANPLECKNAIGVYALISDSVFGMQYQRWFTERFGVQFTGYGYFNSNPNIFYVEETSDTPEYSFSIAVEPQIMLFETAISEKTAVRLFAWGLVGYHGYSEAEWISSSESETGTGYYKNKGYFNNVNLGLGAGFEFMFLKRMSIPIEFGFVGAFPNDSYTTFTVGSGIRFRF